MNRLSSVNQRKAGRRHRWMGNAAGLTLGLLIGGCSSGGGLLGSSNVPAAPGTVNSSPSFGDRVSNFFGNKPAQPLAQAPDPDAITAEDFDCPTVAIRVGASTFSASTAGTEPTAMTLRYQATLVQNARECRVAGKTLTIRVGVEGRIILGPAGGPGQIEIPLRYAVVEEGPEPKTYITKLRWVTVVIPPEQTSVPFSHVEDELSFPMPRRQDIDAFVVYIGFDSAASKQPEKKIPAKKPVPTAKRKT
jgi:hypothetical protein